MAAPDASLGAWFKKAGKRRFFVWDGGIITYYASFKNGKCSDKRGVINIASITEVSSSRQELTIINPDRTWYLQAENDVSAPQWAEILLRRTEYLRTGRASATGHASPSLLVGSQGASSSALSAGGSSMSSIPPADLESLRVSAAASPQPIAAASAITTGEGSGMRLVLAPDSDSDTEDIGESSTDGPSGRLSATSAPFMPSGRPSPGPQRATAVSPSPLRAASGPAPVPTAGVAGAGVSTAGRASPGPLRAMGAGAGAAIAEAGVSAAGRASPGPLRAARGGSPPPATGTAGPVEMVAGGVEAANPRMTIKERTQAYAQRLQHNDSATSLPTGAGAGAGAGGVHHEVPRAAEIDRSIRTDKNVGGFSTTAIPPTTELVKALKSCGDRSYVHAGISADHQALVLVRAGECPSIPMVPQLMDLTNPGYYLFNFRKRVFIYSCPETSARKDRMIYSTTKSHMAQVLQATTKVDVKLEIADPRDLTEDMFLGKPPKAVKEEPRAPVTPKPVTAVPSKVTPFESFLLFSLTQYPPTPTPPVRPGHDPHRRYRAGWIFPRLYCISQHTNTCST
eukprot:m.162845 g.162845  ORF g.162845 m.162845 type:complete len:568 (-) comp15210_c0_seq2:358-2061(-)